MKNIDFQRTVLSDPYNLDSDHVAKAKASQECSEFLASVREMDLELGNALHVKMPADLLARLQFNQEMSEDLSDAINETTRFGFAWKQYAMAACFALVLFGAGFMSSSFLERERLGQDYEVLLSAVMEHLDHAPATPVWDASRANEAVSTLLASYDGDMRLKYMETLQFGRICPMGNMRGLHATLETSEGQVTIAYIKGAPVGDLLDAGYEGYISRVKPVRDGNLIFFSRTKKGIQDANKQLEKAIHWEV